MIKEQLEMRDSFDCELHVKQKSKLKVNEQKKARMCTEWRRARSRVAARSRREKESQLFREIAALLPLGPNVETQLDKASVIRLTIAYLRLRAILDTPTCHTAPVITQPLPSGLGGSAVVNVKGLLHYALGGFLLIMSLNGKIIFTTKDVTSHTGINQMDLIGRSLFDFMHPSDQKELKELLTKLIGNQEQQKCEIFLRIKSAMSHKLMPWRVIHCTGVKKSSFAPGCSCLLLICRSLPVQDVIEMKTYLNCKTFLSIHGPDMKFTFCHSGVMELTGFSETELYGQSVYKYYHPSDCQHIHKAHLCLFAKGQVCTGKYRLLKKHGGYVWVETDATVMYNIRTGKPESVVCINYILSGVQMADVVFSLDQTEHLLTPCDSLQPNVQPIQTRFSTTSLNRSTQATPTTADKHTNSVLSHSERDGAANGHAEVTQKANVCNSLNCDICELDLSSLAPYIPMDEEEFLFTPNLDGIVDSSDRNLTMPFLTLGLEQYPCVETTKGISSTLQHTHSSFSLSHRVSKSRPGLMSSRQRHDILHTVNRKQQVECNSQVIFQNKTVQWKTDIAMVSQHLTKGLKKNSDCNCCENAPGSVPWAPIYSKASRHPPRLFSQNIQEKMVSAAVGLPELSRWECEVNAPLGPTSQLLQGFELTNVLDQVNPGALWY